LIALGSARTRSSGVRQAKHPIDGAKVVQKKSKDPLTILTMRFRNALKKSVEGIIEAGRVRIKAKNELEHGAFI
jgi:hypothetical protein